MARGWVYLVAVLDWASRRVLAHRVSITMEADFCVKALSEAVARWSAPEIVSTDQGSQFSSAEFVAEVQRIGACQTMDGKGCWRDTSSSSGCVEEREVRGRVPQGLRRRKYLNIRVLESSSVPWEIGNHRALAQNATASLPIKSSVLRGSCSWHCTKTRQSQRLKI